MRLASKIKKTIQKYRMLSPGDGVLVAVSGGPDSIALLHVLWKLKDALALRLEVAHVEHGIRGEEAREDARFVAATADGLSLPFHLKELELPRIKAERKKGNLEALAREERYRFFNQVAGERGLGKIATAHTRDDQVETVFMWLLRGTGRKGLGGMAPVHPSSLMVRVPHHDPECIERVIPHPWVIRPLIESSRPEVVAYLASERLDYRTDRTNQDTTLLRNWLRLQLLPALREKFGAGLDERLAHLADLMRDEEELLQSLAKNEWRKVFSGSELRHEPLSAQPKAMQRRLVRLWLEKALGNLRSVEFEHVEAILRLISHGPAQGRVAVPKGREAVRRYDTLRLEKKSRVRRAAGYSYALSIGEELLVPEAGVKIDSARSDSVSDARPRDDLEAVFDSSSLPQALTVRNFRNGDRFQPLGMRGHKKVKALFIEKKVPLTKRAILPLLLAGDEILWIPGYGRSEIAKIGPATKAVLKIRLAALGGQQAAKVSAQK
ncbi:MAG TPA: tRNA lysidine(34) synthetase TilS [Candidatus Binatia bacterium]